MSSEESTPNNSAGRLRELLRRANVCGPNDAARVAVAKMFGRASGDEGDVCSMVSQIRDLQQQALREVGTVTEDIDLYGRPLNTIADGLSRLQLGSPWKQFTQYFGEAVQKELDFPDKLLAKRSREQSVSQEALDGLLSQIEALRRSVLEDDALDREAKSRLIDWTLLGERAIAEYELWGLAGLEAVFDQGLGMYVRVDEHSRTQSGWGKQLLITLTTTASVLSAGKKIYDSLPQAVKDILPLGE